MNFFKLNEFDILCDFFFFNQTLFKNSIPTKIIKFGMHTKQIKMSIGPKRRLPIK